MSQPPPPAELAPQLVMRRPTLDALPPLTLPAGYHLRSFREGDDQHWERIIGESFAWTERAGKFASIMRSDAEFRAERVRFICHGEQPVATASAWRRAAHRPTVGYLHYVGVLPNQTGKALGLRVSLACLHDMVKEGRTSVVLQTDDFRVPAIKTYLKLGFEPLVIDENQRGRWRDVFEVLGRRELCEIHAESLAAPVISVNDVH